MLYQIGQIFEGEYPPEAAVFCNDSGKAYIKEIEPAEGVRRFQIVAVPEPTDEEVAEQVRAERDRRIAETDWYMMSDYPADPETLEVVKGYRKALRDITLQSGFPRAFKWPVVPKVFCEDTEGTPSIGLAKVGVP
jgi:hypothetical protein|nr:MAG TPA: tail assembly chaperone protein [Caudoviricetes sp.]